MEYFKSYLSGEEVILQRNATHGSIAENVDVINQGNYQNYSTMYWQMIDDENVLSLKIGREGQKQELEHHSKDF